MRARQMENYEKGEIKELEDMLPPWFLSTAVYMKVNTGSKIRNLMSFALTKIKDSESKQIVWTGSGNAISKTISCAEIMKRQIKDLHQITDIHFRRIEEYWEPKQAGLERLKANRDVPVISILLSKDPLDPSLPGYQAPNCESQCFAGVQSSSSSSSGRKSSSKRYQYGGVQPTSRTPAMAEDFAMLQTRRDKNPQKQFKPRDTNNSQRATTSSTASQLFTSSGNKDEQSEMMAT